MTALQARVVGVVSDETPVMQAAQTVAGTSSKAVPATRRNRRRPGLYQAAGMQFPLFHAWRP